MFKRVLALIIKETLAVWNDKKSRGILIVPPLIQLLVFAFAATLDVKNVKMGVLNLDHGKQGYELVERFKGSPYFTSITHLQSHSHIAPFIDNQKGVMVLSIDEQFSRDLEGGKPTSLQLILDGRKSNTAQIVSGYATAIIEQFASRFNSEASKVQLLPRYWYNPNLLYYWFTVPSLLAILTMLIGMIITALSVARERELGTFDQLLVSPLGPLEIMVGKTIPAIIIGLLEGSFVLLLAVFIYRIPFEGSLLGLYIGMFFYITSIVGMGLFISAICSTQQQAILGVLAFMAPATILSGFATPIENMPMWLQYTTYLNPVRYFLTISRGIFLKDIPLHVVWQNTWPLAVISIISLFIVSKLFRKRLQ